MRIHKKLIFRLAIAAFMAIGVWSCRTSPDAIFPDGDDIYGLATPVQLEGDTTLVFLTDYFVGGAAYRIDSVTGSERLDFVLAGDRKTLEVVSRSNFIPRLSEMKVWVDGTPYSLLLQRSRRERFTFEFDPGDEGYRRVSVRGEMNDWNVNATPLNLIDGVW